MKIGKKWMSCYEEEEIRRWKVGIRIRRGFGELKKSKGKEKKRNNNNEVCCLINREMVRQTICRIFSCCGHFLLKMLFSRNTFKSELLWSPSVTAKSIGKVKHEKMFLGWIDSNWAKMPSSKFQLLSSTQTNWKYKGSWTNFCDWSFWLV